MIAVIRVIAVIGKANPLPQIFADGRGSGLRRKEGIFS
jgi:hypothetical protein